LTALAWFIYIEINQPGRFKSSV